MTAYSKARTKSLEGRGVDLLAHFSMQSPPVFSGAQAANVLQLTQAATTDLLWRMAQKGWLIRHRSGVYEVAPIWSSPQAPYRPDRFAALSSWLQGDYYIGFRSALEYHDWLTHPIVSQVWVAVPTPRRAPKTAVDQIHWVVVRRDRFSWGVARRWAGEQRIQVSDPERTILDCLHLPRHAGGITEIAAALRRAWPDLDTARLLDYVHSYGLASVRQRLGFLAETLDLPGAAAVTEALQPKGKRFGVIAIDPSLPPSGPIDKRWRVRVNIDGEELAAAGTT